MLDFIKKLFKTKEKIGLTLEKLEEWFDQKTKVFYDEGKNKLEGIKQKIQEEIKKTKENIESLKKAELRNDKITTREKQFMEGSRDFYTKRVSFFIDSIEIPEEHIEQFIEKTHKDIESFGKSTLKAYQVLQHFFRDETYRLAKNIKNIDNYSKELKELLEDKRIKITSEIKEDIKSIKDSIEKEIQFKKTIEDIEKKITNILKEKKDILAEISSKEQSHDYKEYHRLDVEQYQIKEQIEELKEELLHDFSALEHPFKKHMRLNLKDENLLKKYLEDPIKALVEDYELEIKDILERLEENINTKKVELKDKKKEKTLQVLKKINKANLAAFLTEYNQFMVDLRNTEERIKKHTILDDIEDIKIKLKKKKQEIEEINNNLTNLKQELSQIDLRQIKDKIKQKINNLLDIELDLD